ncbi:MAG: aspartate kinase [Candidatus Eisenbacteria bacterium]
MDLVVQKFGGTSLATVEQIRRIADRIAETKKRHKDIIVVVSAMGHTTDRLLKLASEVSHAPSSRELDMLLTAGERISMALLSMAINDRGCEAISFTGSQSGIITDSKHTRARIVDVKAFRISEELAQNRVVIVAGFQGVSPKKEITTLGRGGSDTTAVALASAFRATECEIFTDVEGVFTADPGVVTGARKLSSVSFEEMLELSASGAGVVHHSAVELAFRYDVPLHVRSSFSFERGTMVTAKPVSHSSQVTGIAHLTEMVLMRLSGLSKAGEIVARVLGKLEESGVEVRLFNELSLGDAEATILLVAPASDKDKVSEICSSATAELGGRMEPVSDVALISVVGANLLWTGNVCSRAFSTLAALDVKPYAASCTALTLSCLIPRDRAEEVVRRLHKLFVEEGSLSQA